jgi:hypothetical protein
MSTTTTEAPATRRQRDYILDLLDEREVQLRPMDSISDIKSIVQGPSLGKQEASRWIERLKSLSKKHVAMRPERGAVPTAKSDVPAGRYAVTGEDGTTDFYRVDRPTEGRWAGYTFVKLQLSDEFQRVPLRNTQTILDKISAAGPEQASKRYGRELGHCGVCGRTLTNNDSIEAGIGPVCAAKHSWSF